MAETKVESHYDGNELWTSDGQRLCTLLGEPPDEVEFEDSRNYSREEILQMLPYFETYLATGRFEAPPHTAEGEG
jgi:hypothetical protein